jgi:hypothetical protein
MGMWALWCCFGVLGCVGGLPVYPGHLNVIIIIIIISKVRHLSARGVSFWRMTSWELDPGFAGHLQQANSRCKCSSYRSTSSPSWSLLLGMLLVLGS